MLTNHQTILQGIKLMLIRETGSKQAHLDTGVKMSVKTVLITGSNRGIGLAFTKHYVAEGWKVIAAARDPQSATDVRRQLVFHVTTALVSHTQTFDVRIAQGAQVGEDRPDRHER
jgi:nucleoside-diphosphate-sugar epimerase